jgi:hypothetical protein
MTQNLIITTGTSSAVKPTEDQYRVVVTLESATAPPCERIEVANTLTHSSGTSIGVSVTSTATTVGVHFDPILAEQKQQTSLLNEAVRYGYVPPISTTTG